MFILLFYTDRNSALAFPKEIQASIGQDVKFTCIAYQKIRWFFENGLLLPNSEEIKEGHYHFLIIHNAKVENAGTYKCQTQYEVDEIEQEDTECYLKVTGNLIYRQ